mmetsp:Transcript_24899/g.38180  ORF Transcript_24899/g.38180 Transcript_24899/m.38180 type:complete len:220 (+) Transcript_24899:1373-2032(+)
MPAFASSSLRLLGGIDDIPDITLPPLRCFAPPRPSPPLFKCPFNKSDKNDVSPTLALSSLSRDGTPFLLVVDAINPPKKSSSSFDLLPLLVLANKSSLELFKSDPSYRPAVPTPSSSTSSSLSSSWIILLRFGYLVGCSSCKSPNNFPLFLCFEFLRYKLLRVVPELLLATLLACELLAREPLARELLAREPLARDEPPLFDFLFSFLSLVTAGNNSLL